VIRFIRESEVKLCSTVAELMAESGCGLETAMCVFEAEAAEHAKIRADERKLLAAEMRETATSFLRDERSGVVEGIQISLALHFAFQLESGQ
jgi:hypothetical protein